MLLCIHGKVRLAWRRGSGPTVRRRQLMAELKRLREAVGLTQEDVAEQPEWHPTKVMRIETGRTAPHPNDVRLMVEVYGLTDRDQVMALVKLARDARQRGWWYSYRDVLLNRYDFFIGLESEASSIRSFRTRYDSWPAPDSEDYARAPRSRKDRRSLVPRKCSAEVEVRMARQRVLDKEERPQLWVILDESVIRRVVGGAAVMHAQIEALLAAASHGKTTIQVVPYDGRPTSGAGRPVRDPGFWRAGQAGRGQHLETVGGNLYVDKPEETRLFATAFDHLRAAALSPGDTRAMLRAVAEALK